MPRRKKTPRVTEEDFKNLAKVQEEISKNGRATEELRKELGLDTPTAKQSTSRRFILNRMVDATGTSGIGVVAEGICFSGGKVALHWLSHLGAINVYDSFEVVTALHGHDGKTEVVWID